MPKDDIRWIQRFSNFKRAVEKLGDAVSEYNEEEMSDLEKEGVIQRFEYTFELAWKTLQDLLAYRGYVGIKGPNPVLKQALQDGYISNEKLWRKMKEARDITSHQYNEDSSDDIVSNIADEYSGLLLELKERLDEEATKDL